MNTVSKYLLSHECQLGVSCVQKYVSSSYFPVLRLICLGSREFQRLCIETHPFLFLLGVICILPFH
jgi:hypothetical protein